MKSRNGDAAAIVEPDNNPIAARISPGVIAAWDWIATSGACDDRKRLKRRGRQKLTNVWGHCFKLLLPAVAIKAAFRPGEVVAVLVLKHRTNKQELVTSASTTLLVMSSHVETSLDVSVLTSVSKQK